MTILVKALLERWRIWVRSLVVMLALAVLLLIPLRVIGYGYLPPDDALRHAAKVISGKDWHEILLLRDGVTMDPHPGWHAVLGVVHQVLGGDAETLVVVAVVAMFLLVTTVPLWFLRRPEAWMLSLLTLATMAWPVAGRLFYGRPFLVTMAVALFWCFLWPRLAHARTHWGPMAAFVVLNALATWLHCSWYLLALPVAALLLAQAWRASVRLGACVGVGVFAGACLTGQPVTFLLQSYHHLRWCMGNTDLTRLLVTELRPHDGDPALVLVVALLLTWRHVQKRNVAAVFRDPVFVMILLGWVLGLGVRRFWLDWGTPALLVWMALELEAGLEKLQLRDSWQRVASAAVAGAALFLMVTHDSSDRWSNTLSIEFMSTENREQAAWLPEAGGLFYTDNMDLFFQTFYANPKADWRYVLGFEAGLMRPEELAIFRTIQWNHGVGIAYVPWVQKMKPADRLVLSRPPGPPPAVPGLEWHYTAANIWCGRTPR